MTQALDLTPVALQVSINPGDSLCLRFTATIDMTGWNFTAKTYLANDNGDGPIGSPIDSSNSGETGNLILTPGATSTIDWILPGAVTADKLDTVLLSEIRRVDVGAERMYVVGQVLPVQKFKAAAGCC